MDHVTCPRLFQGQFVLRRLYLLWSTCIPYLKCLCSSITKIWKAMHNVEIRVFWGPGVNRGHQQCSPFNRSVYDFVFVFNRNYSSILYRFRVIAGYLSKVADSNLPHLHLVSPLGLPCSKFEKISGIGKLGLAVLSCGFVCVILCLGILRQYRRVTDGQTQDDC